jgi:hypothetical protein
MLMLLSKSLQHYTSIPTNNVISLDLYLGLSYIKKATIGTDVTVAENDDV